MAIEIKAPNPIDHLINDDNLLIFLAGSIEMGLAKPWQKRMKAAFKDYDNVVLINPRRDAWDASWKQAKTNPQFAEQVNWELDCLEVCNAAIMYFDPATKSPISLLELGLFARERGKRHPKLHVICPKGFYRRGNVDITCERYGVPIFPSVKAAVDHIKANYEDYLWER